MIVNPSQPRCAAEVPGVPGTAGTMLAPKTADDDCFTDVLNWILDVKGI